MMKNWQCIIRNFVIAGFVFLFGYVKGFSQNDSVGQILGSIYKNYDSSLFLTFNTTYTYASDTLFNDFTNDQLTGSYTIYGSKIIYRLGDIEYLQNDSFLIAVYNGNKTIIVANPNSSAMSRLPMRPQIDSLVQTYRSHFVINLLLSDRDSSMGQIQFLATDTLAPFTKFSIYYDTTRYLMTGLEYEFLSIKAPSPDLDPAVQAQLSTIKRKQRLRIDFENYRADNFDVDLYNENRYVWYEDGKYKGVEKYKDYRIFNLKTQ